MLEILFFTCFISLPAFAEYISSSLFEGRSEKLLFSHKKKNEEIEYVANFKCVVFHRVKLNVPLDISVNTTYRD